jgi:hypothetical protein
MPGAHCTHSLACEMKKTHELVTTGSPETPSISLRNGFNGYFVLSPVTGLFCHRRLQVTTRKLDTSVGAPGPHDFAVRVDTVRRQHLRVHRIPPQRL